MLGGVFDATAGCVSAYAKQKLPGAVGAFFGAFECVGGLVESDRTANKGRRQIIADEKGQEDRKGEYLRSERCERQSSLKTIIGSGGKCTKIIEEGLHKYVTLCFI